MGPSRTPPAFSTGSPCRRRAARRRRTAETSRKRNSSRAVHARDGLAPPAARPALQLHRLRLRLYLRLRAVRPTPTRPTSYKFGSLILGGRGRFPVVGTLGQRPITFPATSRALMLSYSRACCCSAGLVRRGLQAPSALLPSQRSPPALGLPAPAATHLALLAHLASRTSPRTCTAPPPMTFYLSVQSQRQGPRLKRIDPSQLPSLGHWHSRSAAAG